MKLQVYSLVPFQIRDSKSFLTRVKELSLSPKNGLENEIGVEDAYRLDAETYVIASTEARLDGSALFLIIKEIAEEELEEALKSATTYRDQLHKHFGNIDGHLSKIGLEHAIQKEPSYAFSFYVFEFGKAPSPQTEMQLKQLATGVLDQSQTETVEAETVEDADINSTSSVYDSWSTVVVASWGGKAETEEVAGIVLRLEIELQATWNRIHELGRRAEARQENPYAGYARDELLIELTSALIFTRRAISADISTRERKIFDALAASSKIDDEINAVQRLVHHRSELLHRDYERRQQSGAAWIAFVIAVVAVITATQAVSSLIQLEGWSQRWWEVLVWVGLGGLFFWLTVGLSSRHTAKRLTIKRRTRKAPKN